MKNEPDNVAKRLLGDFVIMLIFGMLAWGIYAFGLHRADQTRRLRSEGITVQAEVTRVLSGLPRKVDVVYEHAGTRYRREVFAPDPTPQVGQRIAGVILPEQPERVRIRGLDEASIEEDREPFKKLPLFLVLPLFILVAARIAYLKGKDPFAVVGPMVGVILILVIASLNLEQDVQVEIHRRLGPTLWGLPSHLAMALGQLLLIGPLLVAWMGAAVQLGSIAMGIGAPSRGFTFVLWVLTSDVAKRQHGSLRRRFLGAGSALLLALIVFGVWLSVT